MKYQQFICTMHPEIFQDAPGNSPVCRMKLILLKEEVTDSDQHHLNHNCTLALQIESGYSHHSLGNLLMGKEGFAVTPCRQDHQAMLIDSRKKILNLSVKINHYD